MKNRRSRPFKRSNNRNNDNFTNGSHDIAGGASTGSSAGAFGSGGSAGSRDFTGGAGTHVVVVVENYT